MFIGDFIHTRKLKWIRKIIEYELGEHFEAMVVLEEIRLWFWARVSCRALVGGPVSSTPPRREYAVFCTGAV